MGIFDKKPKPVRPLFTEDTSPLPPGEEGSLDPMKELAWKELRSFSYDAWHWQLHLMDNRPKIKPPKEIPLPALPIPADVITTIFGILAGLRATAVGITPADKDFTAHVDEVKRQAHTRLVSEHEGHAPCSLLGPLKGDVKLTDDGKSFDYVGPDSDNPHKNCDHD